MAWRFVRECGGVGIRTINFHPAAKTYKRLNGRGLIPTSVYKAIYDPAKNEAAAYVTPNAPGMEYRTLSIAELEQRIKINVFPKLPAEVKTAKMALPPPIPHGSRSRNKPVDVE